VTPQENIHPSEPMLNPFIVSNDGYIDLHSVTLYCGIDRLGTTHVAIVDSIADSTERLGDIGAGGRTTAVCTNLVNFANSGLFREAHITLIVDFRPDFLPWKMHRQFPFRGSMDDKNVIHWFPVTR